MNFCTVRKWVGFTAGDGGRGGGVWGACPHISAALLRVLHAHLSVAVVSAAQRELPVDTPIRSPLSAHTQENKGAGGGASRYRSSHRCSALSRVRQEMLTLQFPSALPSGGSDPLPNEAGPASSLGPPKNPTQALRPPEVLHTIFFEKVVCLSAVAKETTAQSVTLCHNFVNLCVTVLQFYML